MVAAERRVHKLKYAIETARRLHKPHRVHGASAHLEVDQVLNNRIVNGNTYFHARWQCAVPGSPVAAASRLPPCKGNTPDVVQSSVGHAPGVTIQSGEYNSSRAEFKNIPLSRGVIIR